MGEVTRDRINDAKDSIDAALKKINEGCDQLRDALNALNSIPVSDAPAGVYVKPGDTIKYHNEAVCVVPMSRWKEVWKNQSGCIGTVAVFCPSYYKEAPDGEGILRVPASTLTTLSGEPVLGFKE